MIWMTFSLAWTADLQVDANGFPLPPDLPMFVSKRQQIVGDWGCEPGSVVVNDNVCCWPGQTGSVDPVRCSGEPTQCPVSTRWDGKNCVGHVETFEAHGLRQVLLPAGVVVIERPTHGSTHKQRKGTEKRYGCIIEAPTVFFIEPLVLMEHEVTQAAYAALTGALPSYRPNCPDCPVEQVGWFDAIAYANALSAQHGLKPAYTVAGDTLESISLDLDADGWRFPSAPEWQYAARAGEPHAYSGSDDLDSVGWFEGNSTQTQPVCTKARNPYGFCDMSGNVSEWTSDIWYQPQTHVVRGGSWRGLARDADVRAWSTASTRGNFRTGLRLARAAR
jgi:formylglycine-generating enzyme required for sulfatase activity